MRYRILELLIVVGVIAFAMASLQRADPLFESLFFSFTLLVILAAFLLSIGRRAGARAYWIAFAATSSLYLIFAHVPDSGGFAPRHNGPEVTTQVLRRCFKWMHPEAYDTKFPPQRGSGGGFGGGFGGGLGGGIGGGLFGWLGTGQAGPFGSRNSKDPFATDLPDESSSRMQSEFDALIELITTTVNESTWSEFESSSTNNEPTNLSLVFGGGGDAVYIEKVIPLPTADSFSFVRIGQSAWALLFGWIAGHFTRFIYERTRREPT